MAEGKPCVMRVGTGKTPFEARNLPKRTPGAVHRHVGGTICPMGFTCNTCGHNVRKFARIACYTDYFRKRPKGLDFKLHMFCPECSSEIIYVSENKSFTSGATEYIPPGATDRERKPGFTWTPLEELV